MEGYQRLTCVSILDKHKSGKTLRLSVRPLWLCSTLNGYGTRRHEAGMRWRGDSCMEDSTGTR